MAQNVWETSTQTTQLQQNILPPNGHIYIWCGSRTLTRGRIHKFQTQLPPSCLLLHYLHPHWTEVRHLWTRILSSNKGVGKLAGIPYLNQNALYYWNRPQEPHILEVPKEAEWEDSMLAWTSTRLQLQNCLHCKESKHTSWHTVSTPRRGRIQGFTRNSPTTPRLIPQCVQSRLWWIPQTPDSPSTKGNERNNGRMGKTPTHLTRWPGRWAHLATRDLGMTPHSTKQWNQTRGHGSLAQPLRRGTFGARRNHPESPAQVLMAKSLLVDQPIHKRVCNVPTEQESDTPTLCTPLQNHSTRKHTPFYTDHDGPHHRAP